MNALISIIIPIYKVEAYLNECIASVVNQTYKNLEIILVDDGSPDRCPDMCDEWAKKDERIKVIHKANGGLSDARNAGLKVARGQYIGFVDSDDWISSNMYERLLEVIEEEKADICACSLITEILDQSSPLYLKSIIGTAKQILPLIYQDTKYMVCAVNKLYRKECWINFEFPKGKLCEDAFTAYYLVDQAGKIVQIRDPLYHYRIRENSIMTSTFSNKRMDEEEAWRCNYEYMKEKHPEIYPSAFDFYLQKVNILIHTISKKERDKFAAEYQYLYRILEDNFWYIIFRSHMKLKYRIKFILEFVRL